MTMTQERLLSEARESWEDGKRIHIHLFSLMAQEGMDVEGLEEIYFKES